MTSTLADLAERRIGGVLIEEPQDSFDYFNMLIWGESGAGKTVLAASAAEVPEMAPVLVIDVEGGMRSAASMGYKCDVVRIKSWANMQGVYNELYRGNSGFKTVILDSLTEIQKFNMAELMRAVKAEEADRDEEVPSIREWGKSGEQIRRMVRGFRDLEMNVIFTALADSERDARTGLNKFWPSLPGKLRREVPGYVDEVLYLYYKMVDGETKRLLLTAGSETYICKDRSSRLPQLVEEPTMQILHNLIQETETNGTSS